MFDVEVGSRIGKWTVTGTAFTGDRYIRYVPVRCDCGTESNARRDQLRRGGSTQCVNCRRDAHASLLRQEGSEWNLYFYRYKTNAKNRDLDFDITLEFFKSVCSSTCFYCGTEPVERNLGRTRKIVANGIDRVDSSKGYFPKNCVSACIQCNKMKWDSSTNDFLGHIIKIYNYTMDEAGR